MNKEIITIGCSEYPETILKINKNINLDEVIPTVFYHGTLKFFDKKITEKQFHGMLLETLIKFNLNIEPIKCYDFIRSANILNGNSSFYDFLIRATQLDFIVGRIIE